MIRVGVFAVALAAHAQTGGGSVLTCVAGSGET